MPVTAIIPYHSGQNYLDFCLASLLQEKEYLDEVIVISNHSSRRHAPLLITNDPRVRCIHVQEDMGYSRAINLGVERAKNRLLLLCDADVFFPSPGWLACHVAAHRKRDAVGITSSKLIDYQCGRLADFGIGRTARNHFHPFLDCPTDYPPTQSCRQVQMACSAVMMISKPLFQAVGGVKEGLIHFYQDVDLGLRLKDHGREIWVLGDAIAYHRCASTSIARASFQIDDRAQYTADNVHRMSVDFPDYLTENLSRHFGGRRPSLTYGLVDLSTVNTWDEFATTLDKWVQLVPLHRKLPFSRDCDSLFLMDMLPSKLHQHAQPLLFLVDRHLCLRGNMVWHNLRNNSNDFYIDRHANVGDMEQAVRWRAEG